MEIKKQTEFINIYDFPELIIKDDNCKVKFSIIIPAYNVEDYIYQSVTSILNNSLKDIEVICIDDGSTDNTLTILEEISKTDSRLKFYSQKNKGPGAARNYGLSFAKGKYIYFMDSDDILHERALEYLYYEAEKNKLDMLLFNTKIFWEKEKLKEKYPRFLFEEKINYDYIGISNGKEFFNKLIKNHDYKAMVWLYILRKSFIDRHKIEFPESIIHEDVPFTLQCMILAQKVMYKNIKLHYRRVREGSIMTSAKIRERVVSYCVVLNKIINILIKYKLFEDRENYNSILTYYERKLYTIYNLILQLEEDEKQELWNCIYNNNKEGQGIYIKIMIDLYDDINKKNKFKSQDQKKYFEIEYKNQQKYFERKSIEQKEYYKKKEEEILNNNLIYVVLKKTYKILKRVLKIFIK